MSAPFLDLVDLASIASAPRVAATMNSSRRKRT